MSLSQAVICDGCGVAIEVIRPGKGQKHLVPSGWLRLIVHGRGKDQEGWVTRLGEVEVHSVDCAPFALKDFFDQIAVAEGSE